MTSFCKGCGKDLPEESLTTITIPTPYGERHYTVCSPECESKVRTQQGTFAKNNTIPDYAKCVICGKKAIMELEFLNCKNEPLSEKIYICSSTCAETLHDNLMKPYNKRKPSLCDNCGKETSKCVMITQSRNSPNSTTHSVYTFCNDECRDNYISLHEEDFEIYLADKERQSDTLES